MAGSSSDLHSVSQVWLTAYQILDLHIPGFPKTLMGAHKYLKRQLRSAPDAVRRKRGVQGKSIEYRADLLPIHGQKALIGLLPDNHHEYVLEPDQSPIDLFEQLRVASGHKLFSDPDEMLGDGLNLLSVLNQFMAECSCFNRVAVADAIMHAEGLIRAGHALSKTEGGAA